jgi:O-antigen ligase
MTDRMQAKATIWSEIATLPPQLWQNRLLLVVMAVAIVLGVSIAHENWIYLAVLGALPFVLLWPVQVALGVYALLLPFSDVDVLGGGGTLAWFVGVATAAILLGIGLVHKRVQRPAVAALWWTLFICWGLATALWCLDREALLHRLPTAISLLLFYLVVVSLRFRRKEISWVIAITILGGCLAAGFTAYQFHSGYFYHGTTQRASLAVEGRETDPNQLAASLLLPIALAFGSFLSSSGSKSRITSLSAVALMVLALLLSMSRGGLLSLAVMIAVFLYRLRFSRRMLIPVVILLGLLGAVPSYFFERFRDAMITGGAGRLSIWTVGLQLIRNFGVFGAGLSNFPVAYNLFPGVGPQFHGFGRASHNIYLEMAVELGIPGLLLFFLAVRSQLKTGPHGRILLSRVSEDQARQVACQAACCAVLVAGIFLDILWRKTFWFSWILMAVVSQLPAGDSDRDLA